MAELINRNDSLNDGRKKLNEAIKDSNKSKLDAKQALITANESKQQSESTQQQLDQVVIDGDSSVEAAQARVDAQGQAFQTLKQRLDTKETQTSAQLAQNNRDGIDIKSLGAKTDGTDQRVIIQNIVNEYKNLYVSEGTYTFMLTSENQTALNIPSDVTIEFSPRAVFKLGNHNLTHYEILNIVDVENVTLINPNIDGSRSLNQSSGGEWGHGINIRGSKNIRIVNPTSNNCWGDGIYIGATNTKNYTEDLKIISPSCDNNRRQGISLVSGIDIEIDTPRLTNTNGAQPQAGLDIEPNHVSDRLEKIRIKNPYTKGNIGAGIMIHLLPLEGASTYVDILIENHTNENRTAFLVDSSYLTKGLIKTINPTWLNSTGSCFRARRWSSDGARVEIHNPYIVNANTSGLDSDRDNSTFAIEREVGGFGETPIGNIHIYNPNIVGNHKGVRLLYMLDLKDLGVENVSFINPINLEFSNTFMMYDPVKTKVVIEDKNKTIPTRDKNADSTLAGNNYAPIVANKTYTGNRVYTLPKVQKGAPEITFESWGGDTLTRPMTIQPSPTDSIKPIGGLGQPISSNEIGANITIRKVDSDTWLIVNQVGSWTEL